MKDPEAPSQLPFGMSERTMLRLTWIGAGIFLLIAVGSLVGEILGWWNDLGEVGATVGTLASLLLTLAAIYYNAGRARADRVHGAVVGNGEQLEKLDTLDGIQFELDRQTGVLRQIRDRL